ncbi:MAG: hypothetical protein WC499_02480 [Patescibacteria group bacterium]
MDKYCEVTDIENYTLTEIASNFETQVEDWIRGVSRMFDTLANRKLVAPAIGSGEDYEVQYFDGNGKEFLSIEDCQEIVTLKIGDCYGDNLEVATGYITYPRVAPFRKLLLKSSMFTEGLQNVEITGRFGFFNEVPDDIRLACSIIVAGIINDQNKGNQVKKSESIGNYSVSYVDDKGVADFERAKAIIEGYRRIEF